jgi:hypothetical protein
MNDVITEFRISKRTGTHADVFAAVGLADLVGSIPKSGAVRIAERDAEFVVSLARPLAINDAQRIPQTPGYPFLKANEKVKVPAGVINFVDYKAEKAKADRRKQALSSKAKKGRKPIDAETQQLLQEEQLRDDWRLLQVLNVLRASEATNRVHETIATRKAQTFCDEMTNGLAAVGKNETSDIDWKISTVQLFTPIAAKGYGRLKPDSTDRNDKTKEQWADPFVEWLKYRGYFQVSCPFFQGDDIRLLCPVPHDISIHAFESVAREMRKGGIFGGPPKIDAIAVLKLAELLVRHSEEYHDPDIEVLPGVSLTGKTPADAVSGIMVTHYQSLGTAKAVSAMSTLALPNWFPMETRQDAEVWLSILDEHRRIVLSLNPGDREIPPKNNSDEIGLLIFYRRFLEKRGESAISSLIEFMEMYGAFVMRANGTTLSGRKRWLTRFTDEYFRRLLMGTNEQLLGIIDDAGFEAVARAVRQATVSSQNKRARGDDVWRDIRYELLHDLHRTRKVPGSAFVECIMEFVSRYNYENARRRETKRDPKAAPASVSDEELKSFIVLVERYGTSLVGALLAAYGSCKEKWEPEDAGAADSVTTKAQ